MIQIKIFYSYNRIVLENDINDWLIANNDNILKLESVNYQHSTDKQYTVILTYQVKGLS